MTMVSRPTTGMIMREPMPPEGQGPAGQGGVVAHEGLEKQGQEHDAAVKDEAEEEHDGHPGGVIPFLEKAQVHHGVPGLQLPPDQANQGQRPR